ncbi:MAG: PA2169 family four-helix-bundle protein [Flavobacteriales bacterium]|nr:PA2169 family four-helix-bundle protein [Flavobacteriales bacterium]
MSNAAYLNGLNDIHDLLVDSEKGYKEAAERAEDPGVKALLSGLSKSRLSLISDLTNERLQLDRDYKPRTGTLKGDLHRAWMDLRDSLSSSENANVLKECERGENFLLERYEEVLEDRDLPSSTRELLTNQRNEVSRNLAKVRGERKVKDAIE